MPIDDYEDAIGEHYKAKVLSEAPDSTNLRNTLGEEIHNDPNFYLRLAPHLIRDAQKFLKDLKSGALKRETNANLDEIVLNLNPAKALDFISNTDDTGNGDQDLINTHKAYRQIEEISKQGDKSLIQQYAFMEAARTIGNKHNNPNMSQEEINAIRDYLDKLSGSDLSPLFEGIRENYKRAITQKITSEDGSLNDAGKDYVRELAQNAPKGHEKLEDSYMPKGVYQQIKGSIMEQLT